jgi:hypothetical protein
LGGIKQIWRMVLERSKLGGVLASRPNRVNRHDRCADYRNAAEVSRLSKTDHTTLQTMKFTYALQAFCALRPAMPQRISYIQAEPNQRD